MPQVLKGEVEARLREAALAAFAEHGYAAAGMADIARRAGVSAGNVYRYFPDKAALFAAVVPADRVAEFQRLLEEWAATAGELSGPRLVAPGGNFAPSARLLADFTMGHRREVIILLGQAAGTPWSALPEDVAQLLVAAVERQLPAAGPDRQLPPPLRFALEEIQRSWVWALVRILETFPDEPDARRALAHYEKYHRAGLRALLGQVHAAAEK